MTTRWEKGDSHAKLIIEGERSNAKQFKSALEINFDGNILIDLSAIDQIDEGSIEYLNAFALQHKEKNYSLIGAYPRKIKGLKHVEIVPTTSEARDLIFMEITERELGFLG